MAAYLVPQVMAYAEVASLPPVTGLWAVMGPLLVYAVLGSSRQMSVGPESTTALMTATALAALTAGGALPADAAAALAIAVGGVCLVGWLARLGFLANLLSHPASTRLCDRGRGLPTVVPSPNSERGSAERSMRSASPSPAPST